VVNQKDVRLDTPLTLPNLESTFVLKVSPYVTNENLKYTLCELTDVNGKRYLTHWGSFRSLTSITQFSTKVTLNGGYWSVIPTTMSATLTQIGGVLSHFYARIYRNPLCCQGVEVTGNFFEGTSFDDVEGLSLPYQIRLHTPLKHGAGSIVPPYTKVFWDESPKSSLTTENQSVTWKKSDVYAFNPFTLTDWQGSKLVFQTDNGNGGGSSIIPAIYSDVQLAINIRLASSTMPQFGLPDGGNLYIRAWGMLGGVLVLQDFQVLGGLFSSNSDGTYVINFFGHVTVTAQSAPITYISFGVGNTEFGGVNNVINSSTVTMSYPAAHLDYGPTNLILFQKPQTTEFMLNGLLRYEYQPTKEVRQFTEPLPLYKGPEYHFTQALAYWDAILMDGSAPVNQTAGYAALFARTSTKLPFTPGLPQHGSMEFWQLCQKSVEHHERCYWRFGQCS
jgi:hypothetical protein